MREARAAARRSAFSRSNASLTSPPVYGKKLSRNDSSTTLRRARDAGEECGCARPRLPGTLAVRAEHDPGDLEPRVPLEQRQDRAAAADLDVVGVAADREHASRPARRASTARRQHPSTRRPRAGDVRARPAASATAPRRSPAASRGRACPSACPSAPRTRRTDTPTSLSSPIRRWNGSSTRSSPSCDVVEDLAAEDEVAGVEPEPRRGHVVHLAHAAARRRRRRCGSCRSGARRGRARPRRCP